jgi:hypothetical protein
MTIKEKFENRVDIVKIGGQFRFEGSCGREEEGRI